MKFGIYLNFDYFGVFTQFGELCIWCFKIPRGSPVIPTGSTISLATFHTCSAVDQCFSYQSDKKYKNSDFSQFWIILTSFGAPQVPFGSPIEVPSSILMLIYVLQVNILQIRPLAYFLIHSYKCYEGNQVNHSKWKANFF